ncbi:MAG: hypothetical protein KKA79_00280, partial [Nanoarchaeota archaeon]|nr:hypothetical protein [Nanoarchaeota archaeon]
SVNSSVPGYETYIHVFHQVFVVGSAVGVPECPELFERAEFLWQWVTLGDSIFSMTSSSKMGARG